LHFQTIMANKNLKQAKNICGEIKSKKNLEFGSPMGLILFVAHYDSISRQFAGKYFNHFFKILIYLGLIEMIHTPFIEIMIMINPLFKTFSFIRMIQINFSLVLLFGLIILFINSIGNESKGTCDNASGLTTIINLLNRIRISQFHPEWLDIRVLFCGAEELGEFGSRSYAENHKSDFAQYRKVFVVNLDCISEPLTILRLKNQSITKESKQILQDFILHESNRLNIPLNIEKIDFFRGSDHQSFLNQSYEVVSFCTIIDEIHTKNDNETHISVTILKNIEEILFNVLQLLDRNMNDKIYSGE